jgi:alkylation response protein AidB-like acyl-CoA dehydrogenase
MNSGSTTRSEVPLHGPVSHQLAGQAADWFVAWDEPPAAIASVMQDSLEVLRRHGRAGTLRGPDHKNSPLVVQDLGRAGYWGLLVQPEYGGSGSPLKHFLPFLTRAAVVDAPFAGLASVHGCIGAIDPLQTFGTESQRQRYLPALARGERLSAFASTEPSAGSDLRRIRLRAERSEAGWTLTGQKAFITNLALGRTIGLLCRAEGQRAEGQLAVAIVELPEQESDAFRLLPNPLHPLKHTVNQGARFEHFPLPADALLTPPAGKDGLAIVYHGLNRGRSALAALAAGHLRTILAGMLTWARYRRVQGRPLAELELVQGRVARVAALIAGCDLLARWCGTLLDQDQRCEVEAMIAKVFASSAVRQAAFELALPTHGGRFFLQGHPTGDQAYDYLAPCIYEGENELLSLAVAHTLGKTCSALPAAAPGPTATDSEWLPSAWHDLAQELAAPAESQLALLDRSRRVQAATVASLVSANLSQLPSPLMQLAGQVLVAQLQRQMTCGRPTSADIAKELELGAAFVQDSLPTDRWLGELPESTVLLPYEQA